ncbi:putative drug resistance transporter EmrB/QacA family [Ruegeria lacuscaerulensis ITI-1157]|nr:putative drug resistance transporter EmrB/QacA family [Ruegeria lacuscaerulensis ITI-1157]SHJ73318.1 hypothetical protein SAMN05444404_2524 [Ruegeria lacuscaerulensis ITI-1157]
MGRDSTIKVTALKVTAFGITIDCAGALMLMPAIENPFVTDIASTQWVLKTCARIFAMTMVAGGYRKVMLVGLSVFPFASVRRFIAPNLCFPVGAWARQKVAAARARPCVCC